MKAYLRHKVTNFTAGSLREKLLVWQEITQDREILKTISGMEIPVQSLNTGHERSYPEYKKGMQFIDQEVNTL